MNISNAEKAHILVQALPYIQKYNGKTVVIKYGGNAMINEELKSAVMSDIALLKLVGINVVLVHGGGPEITDMLKKINKESKFVNGMRVTDKETIDIVQMVLAGKVNKSLVQHLQKSGAASVGLCGLDGNMLVAEKLITSEDIGYVGEITQVNPKVINDVINNGFVPIISTVAGSLNGDVYNINADIAASRIAAELGACKLILMTDIRGLLRDKDDEATLIPSVNVSEVPMLKREGIISGGMIPKIDCCVEAVRRGVSRAYIIDGRIPHSILIEMLTAEGIGTMFY
ncbi:MAG: acetylglutamate kinase [Acutalibacteraceae bacterium]|nr:acetylglutamate kinase [Clostridia bacterium]MEE3449152.1 acetylglutamate kinase [Acutalibacteraceae bacterium]